MEIYFMSSNKNKLKEIAELLNSPNITVHAVLNTIKEIQSNDMNEIAARKALEAFQQIRRPVLVDQTGLFIKNFGNLPGGLTQIFWDSLGAEKFSDIFAKNQPANATASIVIAHCDGKKIRLFEGSIDGRIVCPPRGDRQFQWDCIFEPNGYDQTFAEMGEQKKDISMRKIAIEKLKSFLEAENVK